MDLPDNILREIAKIEAAIEVQKHTLKNCLHDSARTWSVTQELRALHTRLTELNKNLGQAPRDIGAKPPSIR